MASGVTQALWAILHIRAWEVLCNLTFSMCREKWLSGGCIERDT